ncbi:MAG: 50S ribosomal protein L6 [Candidatus Taylorbacteria bacterium RIFCSPHIGHO2_02_FULL_47_18]|uniref:50S ribosomal protein L6 n=1 Tax=Candidatus Taylorbacteria bacterium RIFCSPLOWO2_01_FULL_48_100 TaxID=1802322 RepID=A0A1G2NGF5_9BACT|nr:MAG: 50S ribosomal protein L6 [Candidatus Taylorbacteria bacterium RIFCSPHIGHO2_01_FULL_48_38]OHA27708.1 MAG: 50S ribosomal protein L6 [Candidatus Taylorbacteria bacterium RIFCSPHIGHO2_02_FULL_47_18]OHA35160.1 MAG: 50S ribosomal protein L6 [Candidatus Taylorbacteria bacterium RIFCSPLOWO2_01_FULL_48_100]OHA41040.1 MAG: 50S ribosomal protein L6 [Candidatus Taylorbacteria bacterium RIFCSPLOWO2_02_FULL_48_16]OHA45285.1 MAG: 50S ribosomal protein L6 [Candidatus Taylorbacteria bacterium RIFCSPLOWO
MSRLAKKPIVIPEKTAVTVAGSFVTVKGASATLSRTFHPAVSIKNENNVISVALSGNSPKLKPLVGTTVAHIKNMIAGSNKPFEKNLVVEGIGFKADVKGSTLTLSLGFTHPVIVSIPQGLVVTAEKNVIKVVGPDIETVGQFAAFVRERRKPEPYKGKGIRYENEVIRRKQGKKTV